MSLADELIAALDDAMEEDVEEMEQMKADEVDDVSAQVGCNADSIHSIAKLRDSAELQNILKKVEMYSKIEKKESVVSSNEAEYKLIVDANNITVEIDNEINLAHKFVRDIYNKCFPELESLVPLPMEYVRTVKELGNNIDKSKNNEVLQEILKPATIMVVSVTASTTQGQELSREDLDRVMEACDMAIDLTNIKFLIYEYVQSRMALIAPNLTCIVGASTAAKMMGVAGGLLKLSAMPACNVLLLGAQKRTLSGFSTKAIDPHLGFVKDCDIVQRTPQELRRKASRLVAAKCSLAARMDKSQASMDGDYGETLRLEIEQKLEKLQEPPPVKQIKPLPAPIDAPRKKRGGRRHRKMKERLGMTEMRKQANRMNFGAIEDDAYQDDLGLSLGMLGKSSSGRIRGPTMDSKTKAKVSKTLQQKIQKQQVWGGSTSVKKQIAGTSSSVAFTPLQGLEIVNPQAAERRVQDSTAKYFSSTASFTNVKK